jgi:hypothetical protein
MILRIKAYFVALNVNDTQHKTICHYAQRRDLLIVMLSVVMLSVVRLSAVRLSVARLSVVALMASTRGAMTFSMTIKNESLSITIKKLTFSITIKNVTLSKMTFSIKKLKVDNHHNGPQHNNKNVTLNITILMSMSHSA